jgi:ribosomal protein S18 acetylase RimI-like enzyme
MSEIIEIKRSQLKTAASVLVEAFRDDEYTTFVFNSKEQYDKIGLQLYISWTKWAMLYGKAWATPGLESVALRQTPKHPDFSYWNMFRSGMLKNKNLMGGESFEKLMRYVNVVVDFHSEFIGSREHWYAWMIGTLPEKQGMGYGSILMNHTFEMVDRDKVPIFLDTLSERNVELHSKFGYNLLKSRQVPDSDVTVYFMKRDAARS